MSAITLAGSAFRLSTRAPSIQRKLLTLAGCTSRSLTSLVPGYLEFLVSAHETLIPSPTSHATNLLTIANSTTNYFIDFRDAHLYPYNPFPNGFESGIEDVLHVLSQYKSLLMSYNLPLPVPEEFYMPFGAFIDKHNLSSIVRFNHFVCLAQTGTCKTRISREVPRFMTTWCPPRAQIDPS